MKALVIALLSALPLSAVHAQEEEEAPRAQTIVLESDTRVLRVELVESRAHNCPGRVDFELVGGIEPNVLVFKRNTLAREAVESYVAQLDEFGSTDFRSELPLVRQKIANRPFFTCLSFGYDHGIEFVDVDPSIVSSLTVKAPEGFGIARVEQLR